MAVFESLYADRYDQLYAQKNYSAECDLIEAALARHASARPRTLLDVGCGTGGHAIELARRGFQLTGVDLSNAMLDQARQKSSRLTSGQPSWLQGDARSFDTGTRHDAAIMMFAVIGYLTDNDSVLQGLRNIRRHLDKGAVFICDFWYGPSVLAQRPSDRVRVLETGDMRVIRSATTTLDTTHHTADVTFQLWSISGDKVVGETRETHRTRYFFPQEFALFLSQSGFALQAFSAFPSLDAPLNDTTWNALAIAKAS